MTLNLLVFTGNFAGHDKHILSVEGFATVFATECDFENNENYTPQIFNQLSPFSSFTTITEVSSLENLPVKAQSIVRIASSASISVTDSIFKNNWINDYESFWGDF